MAFLTGSDTSLTNLGSFLDPGVTSIDQPTKLPDHGNKTLSRAVALHLEGKREAAARTLSKAIEAGEHDRLSTPRWDTCNSSCAISNTPPPATGR